MNPQTFGQQSYMPQQQPLDINAVYSNLHQTLMKLHQMGVPGLDQVIGALVKAHTANTGPQRPIMPQNNMNQMASRSLAQVPTRQSLPPTYGQGGVQQ